MRCRSAAFNAEAAELPAEERGGSRDVHNGQRGCAAIDGSGSTIGGSGAGQGNVIPINVNSGIAVSYRHPTLPKLYSG